MLFSVERGDCDKACEEADFVYEGTGYFETNPSPLAPEPPEMIMYYDDINNKYLMWATAQSDRVPKMPPDVGRMPADAVIETRVFNVGGSYGNKQEMTLMCLYTAMLSRLTGKPVRFRMNKEDQLTIHEMRLGSRFTARFSIKDGIMTSVKGHWFRHPGLHRRRRLLHHRRRPGRDAGRPSPSARTGTSTPVCTPPTPSPAAPSAASAARSSRAP